ncbi:unnamed protein product [Brassica rapa subsp. narinosa]
MFLLFKYIETIYINRCSNNKRYILDTFILLYINYLYIYICKLF